jgi:hypothetical protein
MSENKVCAVYLGVHVAEKMLSKIFKDVETMPYGNPGYDFICNKGKKIDVKAACMSKNSSGNNTWWFNINRNTVPDHFLFIVFDNRENLNPLHIWLVPADELNHLVNTSISESTVHKWDRYIVNVDEAIKYCDKIKEE